MTKVREGKSTLAIEMMDLVMERLNKDRKIYVKLEKDKNSEDKA